MDKFNAVQSFSKKGYPFDNVCCESFFKYLKKEECNRKNHHSIGELKLSLFEYIEGFYNHKRPHYSLELMTPNGRELAFYEYSKFILHWVSVDVVLNMGKVALPHFPHRITHLLFSIK